MSEPDDSTATEKRMAWDGLLYTYAHFVRYYHEDSVLAEWQWRTAPPAPLTEVDWLTHRFGEEAAAFVDDVLHHELGDTYSCIACLDEVPLCCQTGKHLAILEWTCRHVAHPDARLCTECMLRHIDDCTQQIYDLNCPFQGCTGKVTERFLKCLAKDPTMVDAKRLAQIYDINMPKQYMLQVNQDESDQRWYEECKNSACDNWQECQRHETYKGRPAFRFQCGVCRLVYCRNPDCQAGLKGTHFHDRETCQEYQQKAQSKAVELTKKWDLIKNLEAPGQERYRICPTCRVVTEKEDEACNHMKCKCGGCYCYMCGSNIGDTAGGSGEHYRHFGGNCQISHVHAAEPCLQALLFLRREHAGYTANDVAELKAAEVQQSGLSTSIRWQYDSRRDPFDRGLPEWTDYNKRTTKCLEQTYSIRQSNAEGEIIMDGVRLQEPANYVLVWHGEARELRQHSEHNPQRQRRVRRVKEESIL